MDYFLRIILIEVFATLTYMKVWEKGTKMLNSLLPKNYIEIH